MLKPGKKMRRKYFFFGARARQATGELEYRTWPTATLGDAKVAASSIRGARDAAWRRYAVASARA